MPSRLFISENPATNTVFYVINIEKIPTFPKKNEILTIVAKSDTINLIFRNDFLLSTFATYPNFSPKVVSMNAGCEKQVFCLIFI